jgi:hypothetical protein
MPANNTLRVTGLDFDTIRENLKTFIAAKPEFKDYDFNSSAIGTLLDVLAYNSYYNAFYVNMAVNEAFLDSAQLRENAVSRARALGYTPRSAFGATATINVKFPNANGDTRGTITIPKRLTFNTTANNLTLTFSTTEARVVTPNTTNGFSANLDIVEGTLLTHRFTKVEGNNSIIIPNANVDSRFIDVTVQTDGTNAIYNKVSTLFEVNGNSQIYYLEETANNRPRITFGDGVLGKTPVSGSTIFVEYRVVNASDGNGANNFNFSSTIDGEDTFIVTTNARATGGQNAEDIESIRFNASKNYETQDRAVTAEDYKRIITANFDDIVKSVVVFGGELAQTPVYGRVFIAIRPTIGTVLSNRQKDQIVETLKDFNVQSIEPVIVNPTYLYIIPEIKTRVDFTLTNRSSSQILDRISTAIISYENANLGSFGQRFFLSRFLDAVDNMDDGILGSEGSVKIQKRFRPDFTRIASYTLSFDNGIENQGVNSHPGYITSTTFVVNNITCFFDDDGFGNLRIRQFAAPNAIVDSRAGTVDYTNGIIVINNFLPTSISGEEIAVTVETTRANIEGSTNTILLIREVDAQIIDDKSGVVIDRVSNIATDGQRLTLQEQSLSSSVRY